MRKAAEQGDAKQIEQLAQSAKVNLDAADRLDLTALMHAARNGHTAAVETLVALNATVDLVCKHGTALWCAAVGGHGSVCEALLKLGADKALQYEGKTAAQWAEDEGHVQLGAFIAAWKVCRVWLPVLQLLCSNRIT